MSGNKSVKRNFLYNATYQLLRILTPIVTAPYLARVLKPANNGIYSYTFSITNYFVLFAVLGMSTYGVRAIASVGEDREKRSHTFWGAYFSQLSIAAVVGVAYVIYAFVLGEGGPLICALWGMYVLSAAIDVSWLLFGVEDFKVTTVRSVAVKLLELVGIFVFVKAESDLWKYVALISGGYLLSQLLIWPSVPKYVDWVMPTWDEIKAHYLPNLRLFIPVVAISLYTTLDKIVLGAMAGMTQSGYYEYAERISKIPTALITALGTVMLPRMSNAFAEGEDEQALEMIESSMWFMQMLAFAMMFGLIGIAPVFVPVFFGPDFMPCIELMEVFVLIIPLISASNVIGRQYLIPQKKDNVYTLSVAFGSIVNVAIILLLIPQLGAMGAVIGTVAAEAAVTLFQGFMVRDKLPLRSYVVGALPFVVLGAAMAAIVRICGIVLTGIFGLGALTLLLQILIGGLSYTMLVLAYCTSTDNRHFKSIFGKVLSARR